MDNKSFNLSKEQVDVAFTTNKTMSFQDAMDQFGIMKIDLPLRNGVLQEVRNGFVGSVSVHLKGGTALSLSLMHSRFPNSQNKWYIPRVRDLSSMGYPVGTSSASHVGVGTPLETQSNDGTPRNYASVFINVSMYQFVTAYVNREAENNEYQIKPEAKQDTQDTQDKNAAVK